MSLDMDYIVNWWIDSVRKVRDQFQQQPSSVVVFCDTNSEKSLRLVYEKVFSSVGFLHLPSDLDDMLDSFEHVMNTQAFIVCALAQNDERRKVLEELMDLMTLEAPLYQNSGYISFGVEKHTPVLIIEPEPEVSYLASIIIGVPLIFTFLGKPLFSIDEITVLNKTITAKEKRVFASAHLSADEEKVNVLHAIEIPSQVIAVIPEFSNVQKGDIIGVINLTRNKENEKHSAA